MRTSCHDPSARLVRDVLRASAAIAIAWAASCAPADESTSQTASPVLSPFATTMTSLGPTGWWRLGETTGAAADATGNGNTGTYNNFQSGQRGVAGAIANDADGAIQITPASSSTACANATSPYVSIADNDAASLVKAQDYFGRTVAPGTTWGAAAVGGTWTAEVTTSGTYYSVNGRAAQISETAFATWQIGLPVTRKDADVQVRASWNQAAAGAALTPAAIVARRLDNDNAYRAELRENPGGQLDLRLVKVVRGISTILATTTAVGTYTVGDAWYVRFQLDGSNLRARTWNASASIGPSGWQVTAVDGELAAAGNISIRSSNSGTTVNPTVAFDAFRVQSLGMTVHAFMKPTDLSFSVDSLGYIYWLGKGDSSHSEWAFRFYPQTDASRPKRISGYIWNPTGDPVINPSHQGAGDYFQDPNLAANVWVQVVVVYDPGDRFDPGAGVTIYENAGCSGHGTQCGGTVQGFTLYSTSPYLVIPENSTSPFLIGTKDCGSFFTGALDEVAVFDRRLTSAEITDLYQQSQ
ncbi:MAG: LamG domain-containing protein [Deltaproteobacteria bacterium]|nr:MAG: LamG domain-containing protein [Deltaproteobacteria bacterium]